MNSKRIIFYLPLLFISSLTSQTVTIDYSVQRFLDTVSELDRTKYFTIHSSSTDTEHTTFYNDYNVSRGRGFWGPYSYAKGKTGSAGVYPADKTGGTEIRAVSRFISTEHPSNVFLDGLDKDIAANWAVEYWKDFVTDSGRPEFFEPMNEPFVHASDFYSGGWNNNEEARIKLQMAQVYGAIGEKIHAAPELANMKVVGYSSAWPSLELNDFGHWSDNMKMFMDTAGAHMDAFSTHLYDGVNVTGQNNLRSGSNSEAILDLIESYSQIKWGTVKPHAITEYGGIASGYGDNYSNIASVQTVRSFNHLIFNLLEREDKMEITIPFATGKATWHLTEANNYQPYGAVLFRPENLGEPVPTGWVYTPKIYFYDLWKEFQGKRIEVDSDNPDIQAQAFVNGSKMYVALNNLDSNSQTVNLNFTDGLPGFQNVRVKSLKVYDNLEPIFANTLESSAPASLNLIAGETVTLEYTFDSAINFDKKLTRKKYYPNSYLQAITANTGISFSVNNVVSGNGKAKLRMSIGRKHNVSKSPVVTINGNTIAVPTNWKGYDQANRDDFFGTIEIPFSTNYLTANNTINITFPDSGGHVAAIVLEVETYEDIPSNQTAYPNGTPHLIPGIIEAENYDNGGEGFAYSDTTSGDADSGGPRLGDDVDSQYFDSGSGVGYIEAGEYLEYTVQSTAGTYDFDLRFSAPSSGTLKIYQDNFNSALATINYPSTTSFWTYSTSSFANAITLTEESNSILRFEFVTGNLNVNYVNFRMSNLAVNNEGYLETTPSIFPNPFKDRLNLRLPNNHPFEKVIVSNVFGKIITTIAINENVQINLLNSVLKNAKKGVYLIQLVASGYISIFKVLKL